MIGAFVRALCLGLASGVAVNAQDPVPSPPPPVQEPPPVEKPVARPADKPTEKPAEKPADKPSTKPPEKPDAPVTPVTPTETKGEAKAATKGAEHVEPKPDVRAGEVPAVSPKPSELPAVAPLTATAAFDYSVRATQSSFEAELKRLQSAHPTRLRLASLGQSRGGRDVWLATAGDLAAGDPDKRPALFVVTALDPAFDGRPAGPEAALFGLATLLDKAARDAPTAEALARTSVYVVCAVDPDQQFSRDASPGRACRLDRNFPEDWKPWSSETCAQGPYPLSEPETRAVARFLAGRANIGGVILLSHAQTPTAQGLAASAHDAGSSELERILCERLARPLPAAVSTGSEPSGVAEALARRIETFAREPGSLAAFCRARLSAFVMVTDPWETAPSGPGVPAPDGASPAELHAPVCFASVPAAIERLAAELPRVACNVGRVERLREKLWMVDLEIENLGLLPTLGESDRARCSSSVWFDASGARVLQTGIVHGTLAEVNAIQSRPGTWMLGHLDGREKLRAHLLVEAPEGASLELAFRTRRAGESRFAVPLK